MAGSTVKLKTNSFFKISIEYFGDEDFEGMIRRPTRRAPIAIGCPVCGRRPAAAQRPSTGRH